MPKSKIVRFKGKEYTSQSALARAYGISSVTLARRIRVGIPLTEALDMRRPNKSSKPIKIGRKVFKSNSEAAAFYEIGLTTFLDRLKRQKMTPEEAIKTEKRNTPKITKVGNSVFSSLKTACIQYKVPYNKIVSRLENGWSLDEAFGLRDRPDEKISGVIYCVESKADGRKYIGHTRTTIDERWEKHLQKAVSGAYPVNSLQAEIARLGEQNFKRKVLKKSDGSLNHLLELEKQYIRKMKTEFPNGFNLSKGGEYRKVDPLKYEVGKQIFSTIKEAANAFGLSASKLHSRMRNQNLSLEEALNQPNRYREYILEGKKYSGLKHAAETYSLNSNTVRHRLYNGWNLNQAFELDPPPSWYQRRKNQVSVDDELFNSLSEAARFYSLDPGLVKSRARKGWSFRQALGVAPPPQNKHLPKAIQLEGKTYKNRSEAARTYDLDPVNVNHRITKLGWSLEEAFELVSRRSTIVINGLEFASLAEAARQHNVKPDLVGQRLRNGRWTLREALEIVPRKVKKIEN